MPHDHITSSVHAFPCSQTGSWVNDEIEATFVFLFAIRMISGVKASLSGVLVWQMHAQANLRDGISFALDGVHLLDQTSSLRF